MTNLDSILRIRDITLLRKVCLVKAMVFPVVMYMCTPQLDRSEMFTELYRDEKKEEGDRGGQKDKRGE